MRNPEKYGKIKMYEFSNEGENIMNEIKNKIITISGEPASGKSTVKKALVKKYTELGYNVHEYMSHHDGTAFVVIIPINDTNNISRRNFNFCA